MSITNGQENICTFGALVQKEMVLLSSFVNPRLQRHGSAEAVFVNYD
jgi:hypothetical protein